MEPLPKKERHPADYRDDIEHADVAGPDRNAKLRLVYIGGINCQFCRWYQSVYVRGGKMKQLLGEAFNEVEYVSVDLPYYNQPLTVAHLPDELTSLLAKDADGNTPLRRRGNPYFAAPSGNLILVQGHGETTLEKVIVPALKYAVEIRRGSK